MGLLPKPRTSTNAKKDKTMNKLTLIIAIVFSGMLMQAQITDLDIVQSILCKPIDSVSNIVSELGAYASFKSPTKLTVINGENINRYHLNKKGEYSSYVEESEDVVHIVSIRYYRNDPNHMKSFAAYRVPNNNDIYHYEHSMGSKLGHLKIMAHCVKVK